MRLRHFTEKTLGDPTGSCPTEPARLAVRALDHPRGAGVCSGDDWIDTLHLLFRRKTVLSFNSNTVRTWYGFIIGSAFAGVVGTGFYPLMGNRVVLFRLLRWRLYLGLVQRFVAVPHHHQRRAMYLLRAIVRLIAEMGIDALVRSAGRIKGFLWDCRVCAAVCLRGCCAR